MLNPCNAAGLAGDAVKAINAVEGLGNALNAVDDFRQGNYLAMAGDAAGVLLNTSQLFKSCFAAGTPLLTAGGFKLIETITTLDLVLAAPENDPTAPPELRRVMEVFHTTAALWDLRVGGKLIRTTAEHPFYVRGKDWVPARELATGDLLMSHDGQWTPVESIADSGEEAPVYNLRVEGYHTYFVGSDAWGFSVWAHNACNVPGNLGGKKLIRYGRPATVEGLAEDAARAEAKIGLHGVSAILRNAPKFPHGQADFHAVAELFEIIKTGADKSHFTVVLPKPVTQGITDLFNLVFKCAGA